MNSKEYEAYMRSFETIMDRYMPPELHIVVRVDGRGFTRLTKELLPMEKPFDPTFRDAMVKTLGHLMYCGFQPLYGYTQSDEISILLRRQDETFRRSERKILSIFAGEASAMFSVQMKYPAAFDARLSLLPSEARVVDYFRWRQQDAARNALNGHCYWKLREEGMNGNEAQRVISGTSVAEKNEMLFKRGVNFDSLPVWQKRGIGMRWVSVPKEGLNPRTGETLSAMRTLLHMDGVLPIGADYSQMLRDILASEHDKEE